MPAASKLLSRCLTINCRTNYMHVCIRVAIGYVLVNSAEINFNMTHEIQSSQHTIKSYQINL